MDKDQIFEDNIGLRVLKTFVLKNYPLSSWNFIKRFFHSVSVFPQTPY